MKTFICEVAVSQSETDDRNRFAKLNQTFSGKTKMASIDANSASEAKRKLESIYGSSNVLSEPNEIEQN